jgi:DNA-binding HxlR family transcriptional regulator
LRYYYKHTLDYAIVEIFDTSYRLRYHELEEEIRSYCKLSSATLSRHLARLINRNVLYKDEEINGRVFYSLTVEFNDSLNIQRKNYPWDYLEKTLSLHNFNKSREFGSSISQF